MLPQRTKPFKHDYLAILAKYPASASLAFIAKREGVNINTLRKNVWKYKLRPRADKTRLNASVAGRCKTLILLLDQVNAIRQQDLTGPEACGAITDFILDALDALGG